MKRNHRFVFDTNALLSASLIPTSVNRMALQKATSIGELVFAKNTFQEFAEVLMRSKFDKYLSVKERLEVIEELEGRYAFVEVTSDFQDCRDTKDNKFLNLAFDTKAICIVTGDKDLLVLHPFESISILKASDFISFVDTLTQSL